MGIKRQPGPTWFNILMTSFKLGLTSFGGPLAHLGFFQTEYVQRKKWLTDTEYADLIALCQFLPGPTSSEVGIGIGMIRAGLPGAVAAWVGFTLPSALLMLLFAALFNRFAFQESGIVHGLKIAAVAIVFQALLGMAKNLAPDRERATIAVVSAVIILLWPFIYAQIVVIAAAGLAGVIWPRRTEAPGVDSGPQGLKRAWGFGLLAVFFGILILTPVFRFYFPGKWLAVFDIFYRAGSLVFGGGHVVLPLLGREVVPNGWVSQPAFLAGYGLTQAVPGPLFTFAAYLGFLTNGLTGALLATIAIFLPGFLLVLGILPYWTDLRRRPGIQRMTWGINAAVVGILLAALYQLIWSGTMKTNADFCLAAVSFGMLKFWNLPPWLVVIVTVSGSLLLNAFHLI